MKKIITQSGCSWLDLSRSTRVRIRCRINKDYLTPEQLDFFKDEENTRLTRAHNFILKKELNNVYFNVNKNESKDTIYKITPDDFVFPLKAEIKKQEAREKFLKKYLKIKKDQKEQRLKLKNLRQMKMKSLETEPDFNSNTSFPLLKTK